MNIYTEQPAELVKEDGRQAVLIGNMGTKRTNYLWQAAEQAGLSIILLEWPKQNVLDPGDLMDSCPDGGQWQKFAQQSECIESFVKIDPPLWDSYLLEDLDTLAGSYKMRLEKLAYMAETSKIEFLNHPLTIVELLNKRACKAKLAQAGVPVTESVCYVKENDVCHKSDCYEKENGRNYTNVSYEKKDERHHASDCYEKENERHRTSDCYEEEIGRHHKSICSEKENGRYGTQEMEEQKRIESVPCRLEKRADSRSFTVESLLELMRQRRVFQVFIKPVSGSGAAGVSAFRWQPVSGRMMLYTCALFLPGIGLVNTKRLRCFKEPQEVYTLLEQILKLDCIVERWYAKAEYEGHSYDLRAVMQDGRLDFLLARLSKGPITNLHLNNHPMAAAELGLSAAVLENIEEVCKQAVGCFQGLRSVGIDILLEKGKNIPRIIEMNAQGDLIYQDIFHENIIYRHQADIMLRWCGQRENLRYHGFDL